MEQIKKFCDENGIEFIQQSIFHNVFDYQEKDHELVFKKDGKGILIKLDKERFNEDEDFMVGYVINTLKRKIL